MALKTSRTSKFFHRFFSVLRQVHLNGFFSSRWRSYGIPIQRSLWIYGQKPGKADLSWENVDCCQKGTHRHKRRREEVSWKMSGKCFVFAVFFEKSIILIMAQDDCCWERKEETRGKPKNTMAQGREIVDTKVECFLGHKVVVYGNSKRLCNIEGASSASSARFMIACDAASERKERKKAAKRLLESLLYPSSVTLLCRFSFSISASENSFTSRRCLESI